MKDYLGVLLICLAASMAQAQTPVQRALANQRSANAAAAQAAAVQAATDQKNFRATLNKIHGEDVAVVPACFLDGNWQAYTNAILKLLTGIDKNTAEKNQLELVVAGANGASESKESARLAQLNGYLENQGKALQQFRVSLRAIEAKYALRDMKAKP